MPRYDFQCGAGVVAEVTLPMVATIPAEYPCDCARAGCTGTARRIWEAPAAIHFHGRGFYATDVKGAQERRRRPNAGDKLHRPHDSDAAAIAESL